MRQTRLGKKQETMLRSLVERGSWPGNGIVYGTNSETIRILRSLAERGLVLTQEASFGTIFSANPAASSVKAIRDQMAQRKAATALADQEREARFLAEEQRKHDREAKLAEAFRIAEELAGSSYNGTTQQRLAKLVLELLH